MPDMILIGGDMLVAKEGSSVQEALEFVKKLPHICQVYYTNGNHEQRMKENTDIYGDTYERYKAKLENCGVCFLENKAENIEKNGMKFSIYGLELDSSVNRKFKKADVTEKTVEEKIGKKGKDYSILMAHNPAYMDAYKKWGADLILSGVTSPADVLYKSCLYLIAAKPFNSVTVPSSFGRLIPSNEIGRYAMATESKRAIASKIRVRRDFKIRFISSLKSRILSVLLFQVCLRKQPQIQVFQSWFRCNRSINFRVFGQITNRNLIVIFASLIDNVQPHFTFRQL